MEDVVVKLSALVLLNTTLISPCLSYLKIRLAHVGTTSSVVL